MPCYHRKSSLQQKDDTYFGITVSENPGKESLQDINVQEFIQKGLEFHRFKGSAEDFSNMVKEGNLVKLSIGGRVYDYNASIYRVEDIIEVTCCKEKKKAMKYSYHGKEVKDGPNKRWKKYQYIFLQPFNQIGHNVRIVICKGKTDVKKTIIEDESSLNSFLHQDCYTSDKNINNFISDFEEATIGEKVKNHPSLHKSERDLNGVAIPPDTLLAENLEINTTEVISCII